MSTRLAILIFFIVSVLAACNIFRDTNTIWEFKTGYPATTTPVVSGDHVYIDSGRFYCLDRRTGKVVWQFETFGPMSSAPVIADGLVYFQCGGLYCIDAATGKLRWEFWREDWAEKRPAVTGGFVYAAIKNKIYCLDAKNGTEVWKAEFKTNASTPIVAEANVYLQAEGELFCLHKRTGYSVWKISIETETPPAALQNRVFVIEGNTIRCLDAKKGDVLWSNDFNYSYPSRLAVAEGRVFIRANSIYCFNSGSGKLEWNSDPGKRLTGIPRVSGLFLYVRSSDGRLNCLNQATGSKIWDIKVPAGRWTIDDGNVFVSTADYKIYCLKISDR
jgi:outer membrane protein assembly factor BamB